MAAEVDPTYRYLPPWRLHFAAANKPEVDFEVVVINPVTLGLRTTDDQEVYDLKPFGAKEMGVSRFHAKLFQADGRLCVVDLATTNGTRVNGRRLEPNKPCPLTDGDLLELGLFQLLMRVVSGPQHVMDELRQQADLTASMKHLAKAITSQLDLDRVLQQTLAEAMRLTEAHELSLWLLDESSGELVLEAERGITDEGFKRSRLQVSDPYVNQVLQSGKPLRASRDTGGLEVRVNSTYMVEALLYVPIIYGRQPLGVLAAAHHDPGRVFTTADAALLEDIADFAAIAIHNARLYTAAQEADRLKAEMIQNVSHEFRTPLACISGYLWLALQMLSPLPEEAAEYFQIVSQQVRSMTSLLDNFAALESVSQTASLRSAISLADTLAELEREIVPAAAARAISLSWQIDPDLPPVYANGPSVVQITQNLLSNALKFTAPGGAVALTAYQNGGAEQVYVAVSDTGIGISAHDQERLFQRFVQLDGSMTRQYGGVGLGLAVCKELVEAQDGYIWVESEPDRGSTFTFSLPVAPADAPVNVYHV